MANEGFQKIYPFTTENIAGYIRKMDIKNKNVLTLGSSCDQALNSLLLGANEVTVFDINDNTKNFFEMKKELILETSRNEIVDRIVNSKEFLFFDDIFTKKQLEMMNLYLKDDENYNKLRNILEKKTINFIIGNIFDLNNSLAKNHKYDRLILSNVLQYLPKGKLPSEEIVYKLYNDLIKYLNDDAIIQLYYLYGSMYPQYFIKLINKFEQDNIFLELFLCDQNDSVIFVKKR